MKRIAGLSIVVLFALGGVAGCGGGGQKTVKATDFLNGVCGTLESYQSDSTDLFSDLDAAESDASVASDKESFAAARDNLVKQLDALRSSTDALLKELSAAGKPDVDNGSDIATSITDASAAIHKAIDDGKKKLQELDPSKDESSDLTDTLSDIQKSYGKALQPIDSTISDSSDLLSSVGDVSACSDVFSGASDASDSSDRSGSSDRSESTDDGDSDSSDASS